MIPASRRLLALLTGALALAGAFLLYAPDARAVDIPEECFTPSCPYEISNLIDLGEGLDFPVAMDFLPDGRLLIAQKGGEVLQWDGASLEPWGEISGLNTEGERGLLGLTVDTNFANNDRVYVYYTRDTASGAIPTVAYFRETAQGVAGALTDVLPLLEQTGSQIHLAGNLHMKGSFIYVSVGDYGNSTNAENRDVPMGKVLKIRRSGEPAPNPPWGEGDGGWDEYVWARGLRNPFDFDFEPDGPVIWATENGPSNCDEINAIERGRNYGWSGPLPSSGMTCDPERGQFAEVNPHEDSAGVDPWDQNSPIAPTGIVVYTGSIVMGWEGDLFYCSWVEGKMRHANLSGGAITGQQIIDEADCTIDVIQAPNGEIWYLDVAQSGAATLNAIGPNP
jgi:glucose/arabinose dehydrogenase